MYFKLVLLGFLFFGWNFLASTFLFVHLAIEIFGKRIFSAFFHYFFTDKYNDVANSLKIELFKELNDTKPNEKISILEIGGGTGSNFKYWTREASVEVVEPNPHFVPFFLKNRARFPHLEIKDMKQGAGEDLAAVGVQDNSVDAVVMTLVLCTVEDQAKCLQEIKRVLKPGGKFYYLEHVVAEEGNRLRTLQTLLMTGGFWTFMVDGCCADRATHEVINKAGFSSVQQKKFDLPLETKDKSIAFKALGTVIKPHLMGVATK